MNLFNVDAEILQKMLLNNAQQETLNTLIKDLEDTYGRDAVDRDAVKDYLLNPESTASLDARQRFMVMDKLMEQLEVNIRMTCDLIRYKLLREAGIVETMDEFLRMLDSQDEE